MESLIRRRINSFIKVTKHGEKALSTFQLDGDVQNVSFKIEPPAHADDIEKIKRWNLPQDYIEFLSITNGLFLFDTTIEGIPMGYTCEVYSIRKMIKEKEALPKSFVNKVPILHIRDVGDMYIDIEKYRLGKSYLTYPGIEADRYFDFSFSKWLDKYMVAGGNEFWNF